MRDVAEGDKVSRGAMLVRIRSSEYEDKVHQASSQAAAAEAVFQKAKLDFDRATHLYDSQSLTKPDFDSARAQYDASQEQLKSARALTSEAEIALRDTSLIAPFDGDIVKKAVELARSRTWCSRIRAGQNRHRQDCRWSARYGCPFRKGRPARGCCHRRVPHTHISRANQPHVIGGGRDYA